MRCGNWRQNTARETSGSTPSPPDHWRPLAARGIQGFPDMRRIHSEKAPLQRNITHREVGDTALYLCSDLSSGVTGAVIPVDAGYHVMAV